MEDKMEWKKYRKTAEQEMRPYIPGESLEGVSVAPGETPVDGGMIARDKNGSQWYITNENYEEVNPGLYAPMYPWHKTEADLAPCGQINPECEPGYLGPGNAECDYTISRERPNLNEKECPDCGALVCVDGIEKYGQVECHNCFAMLEYDGQSLIELSE